MSMLNMNVIESESRSFYRLLFVSSLQHNNSSSKVSKLKAFLRL